MPLICPKCGNPSPDGALFCERDGARLTPDAPPAAGDGDAGTVACRHCGAGPEANEEGYCASCGRKWETARAPQPRDHVEIVVSDLFGGVTDRGRRHPVNEDDLALAAAGSGEAAAFAIVVCDGVSFSGAADRGSAAAAKAAIERLTAAPLGDGDSGAERALVEAVAAAHAAVCALPPALSNNGGEEGGDPDTAATTLVAALVRGRTVSLAWIGDSRAYLLDTRDPDASHPLTRDHSWMNAVVDSGKMTEDEARHNRLAHAITRFLGPSEGPESSVPSVTTLPVAESEGIWLLLCTDGLWNYAPQAAQIAALVRDAPQQDGAVGIARELVAWANAQGGRDNVTVALLRMGP